MKFKEAYIKMLEGKKIKRPCFEGYWYIDGADGKFKIKLKNGEIIDKGELNITLINALAEDWEVKR